MMFFNPKFCEGHNFIFSRNWQILSSPKYEWYLKIRNIIVDNVACEVVILTCIGIIYVHFDFSLQPGTLIEWGQAW